MASCNKQHIREIPLRTRLCGARSQLLQLKTTCYRERLKSLSRMRDQSLLHVHVTWSLQAKQVLGGGRCVRHCTLSVRYLLYIYITPRPYAFWPLSPLLHMRSSYSWNSCLHAAVLSSHKLNSVDCDMYVADVILAV